MLAPLGLVAVAALVAAALTSAAPGVVRLDAQREQIRQLEAELHRIDEAASAAAQARAAAAARTESLRERIAANAAEIRRARAAQRQARIRLEERLVAIYTQRTPTLVEVLLTSGSLTDAVDAQSALETIGAQDRSIVERLRRARERLARARAALMRDRAEARAQARDAQARLSELEDLLASRRAVLDRARATLDRLVAEETARREAEAARRARARALAAAQARAEEELLAQAGAAPAPAPGAAPAPPAPSGSVGDHLERIAQCESGGNPRAVSASGQYRGKYQFDPATWAAVGGTGDPAAAPEAEQDRRAALLYAQRGPAPWPVCGYR